MVDIEIPFKEKRDWRYRFFEILPGGLSWFMLALPFILSIINVTLAAAFVFLYILIFLTRAVALAIRALQGYGTLRKQQKFDWREMLNELETGVVNHGASRPKWHPQNIARFQAKHHTLPSDVIQAVIVATYNESREILEPTFQSILNSDYDAKKIILVLAYEERGGQTVEDQSNDLIKKYRKHFLDAMAIKHPKDLPGEIIGKGGNVTHAGQELKKYLASNKIDPKRVIVTTLDADNRPDKKYFAALTYTFCVCDDPEHVSFQPIAMYTNNIWDAPAPMRVVATGNSFFHIAHSLRPHMLRNFSAHSQGMQPLIEMNFWSTRTVVEDGHHFWRSYFYFDGHYRVLPIYLPIYQDAVLTDRYVKTLKAQFIQYRRWTWGASDIAYVANQYYFKKHNRVNRWDFYSKFGRLVEGHVTWAVGSLLIFYAGWVPSLFHPTSYAAYELPLLASSIQRYATVASLATLYICIKTLPPKPERYKRHRTLFMILQWIYLPLTTIIYNSCAAIYSQTRLMFGRYLDKFDLTEKAAVSGDNTKKI